MTQTKRPSTRKAASHQIQLAPDQIYLVRPNLQTTAIQSIVAGYPDWSTYIWDRIDTISLYYQGHYITSLIIADEVLVDERYEHPDSWWSLPAPASFTTLTEAVEHYLQMPERLATQARWNQEAGLKNWCVRQSFTPTHLQLQLNASEQDLEHMMRLAQIEGRSLETLALEGLYKRLAQIEQEEQDHQAWLQEQSARANVGLS